MLAVVERRCRAGPTRRARPPSVGACSMQRHRNAGRGERHGGRASCPAAADHGDARAARGISHGARVFQAIQSLRSGVSAMR